MEALLSIVLSNAVAAIVLAVLASVAARFCRRPTVRHALWLLVLLKLIAPPLLSLWVGWPRAEEVETRLAEAPPSAVILPPMPAMSEPIASDEEDNSTSPQRQQGEEKPLLTLRAGEVWIVVWLGGAMAWWTVAVLRLRKFRRLLRQARPAPVEVREQVQRLAAMLRLRRCPPILFVSAPLSPMLWAMGLSPRLLVPTELWRKLTAEQQDTLLAHELAHLCRGDHWVRRLEFLVLGLYWWHPVVWWARRRLQEAEEECCDALVVVILPDAAEDYASALVETVAFLSNSRLSAPFGASGAGHVPLLKRRLTMILTQTSSHKRSRLAFWIVLGLGALLLPLAPRAARTEALAEPQGEKDKGAALKFELPFVKADEKPLAVDFGFPLVNPHKNEQQFCLACHQQPVPGDDFHGKPQSWRKAHDEIVRLMDEIRQRQAQLRAFAKGLPASTKPDHSEEIEKVQDEIELLKVQVRLKEVRVEGAASLCAEHRRRLLNYRSLNQQQRGTIPTDTLDQQVLAVTTQDTQVKINKAELQETQVRLKQAERRLARLRGSPEKIEKSGGTQQEKRLQELEQNVEKLLKEIRDLRRQMQPDKPSASGKPGDKSKLTPREKRMLRWLMLFDTHNGEDYVAQLRGLGASLAIPVRENGNNIEYKTVRDLKARPAKLEDEDVTKIQRIYWIDNKPKSVGDALAALGIRLPAQPSHFVAFMPEELENKLYRLEKSYLDKHHAGRAEDDILETKFRINRSGSSYEPEVKGLRVK